MAAADQARDAAAVPVPGRLELSVLRVVGGSVPPLPRGTAVANRILKPIYLRKPRRPVVATVGAHRMVLDPNQAVDAVLLLSPRLYDRHERAFLRSALPVGGVFIDVGAYTGLYALEAAIVAGHGSRIIAIEPNPESFGLLRQNIAMNSLEGRITPLRLAISDRRATGRLITPSHRNRSGTGVIHDRHGGDVECLPLADILEAQRVARPNGVKLDVEGFEPRVIRRWFADVGPAGRPDFLIVETVGRRGRAPELDRFMRENGFGVRSRHLTNAWNTIYVRAGA